MLSVLARVQSRWRMRSIALAVALGGAVFALAFVMGLILGSTARTATATELALGAIATTIAVIRSKRLSLVDAAEMIERHTPALDNLIVTAADLESRPRPVRGDIREELDRQVVERLSLIDATRVVSLAQPLIVAAVVLVGCALLTGVSDRASLMQAGVTPVSAAEAAGDGRFNVTISPPAYLKRVVEVMPEPVQISVIAGSRVRIEASHTTLREWIATASEGIEIRPDPNAPPRFLSVIVLPDAPPQLRIVEPGKDLAIATPTGTLAVNVESRDDFGLASVTLRFIKASGGGENVAFTEGEVPLTIERRSDQQWFGRAAMPIGTMGLADGDILVYRAIARDTNPLGMPVQSEQYLIEIGKASGVADSGFSLPAEEKKYAISQQMVIYKTQQLLAAKSPPDALAQAQGIAVEQRMVRAEVVFLGGGEVEDEVAEAASSDELTEGRLQNTGRAEMIKAITAMSRAEAQLNEGKPAEALVFEKAALASLERALDRRRYFLRTLPDRSRIDVTRRLTGERKDARSWLRQQASLDAHAAFAAERAIMRRLASAATSGTGLDASLAAGVVAVDPSSPELQKAAVAIASASSDAGRKLAVQAAMSAVTAHAMKTMASSAAIGVSSQPLAGKLADESRQKP